MIKFSAPSIGEEEIEAMNRVMRSGWLAAGKETELFEQEFSAYISPPGEKYYCIFTNSCTSALKMAYKLIREQGYEGITYPENTFCATYAAAVETGLRAYPRKIQGKTVICAVESGIKTAEVNVHYAGILQKYPSCLIEDSAHRIEPNDPLIGKIRCYSFYVTKNMTTIQGGMFVTNDKETYERARLYWKDGLTTSTADRLNGVVDYRVEVMAGGYDSNDVAAAIGRVQLRRLPRFTDRRNAIVKRYNEAFGGNWQGNHLYPVFVPTVEDVMPMRQWLFEQGIQSGYHYPNTGWTGVSLPLSNVITDEEVDEVIMKTQQYLKEKKWTNITAPMT